MLFFLTLTLYYGGAILFLLRGLLSIPSSGKPAGLTFSIVIAARNEEQNIRRCLDAVFTQTMDPARFEVVVVNDRSGDSTGAILKEYASRHAQLSVVTIQETPKGIAPKKHAIAQGVEKAKNEVIVQTDADCMVPTSWLETIDRTFTPETGLVQGITAYERPLSMQPVFFGLQAVDFLSHGIVAAAAIGARMPINSNANNFAYRRAAFDAVEGYGNVVRTIISGDDDLLLQRIAGSRNWKVRFMADPQGAVSTTPTETLRGVFEQRKRWGSKTVHYSLSQMVFLSGIFLFYCGIAASFCLGFFNPVYFVVSGGMIAVKMAGELILMVPGTKLFHQERLRPFILPMSLLQLPMVLAAVVLGVFGRFSWKGERFSRKAR